MLTAELLGLMIAWMLAAIVLSLFLWMLVLIWGQMIHTNLRSEWYNKGNDERGEEDLLWERESHEPQLIIQSKKSNVA